jgi:hypothetical protein
VMQYLAQPDTMQMVFKILVVKILFAFIIFFVHKHYLLSKTMILGRVSAEVFNV